MIASDLHLRQTRAFIDVSPSDVVLFRSEKVPDNSGGVRRTSEERVVLHDVRVVGFRTLRPTTTADGREVVIEKAIVSMPETDVQIGDQFDWNDQRYEILVVNDQPDWHLIAEAGRRG